MTKSSSDIVKPSIRPEIIPGMTCGSSTVKNARAGVQPRSCAASDSERCGLLLSNYMSEAKETEICLSGLTGQRLEVRVTDKERTYERLFNVVADREVTINMKIGEDTVIYIGTPIDGVDDHE